GPRWPDCDACGPGAVRRANKRGNAHRVRREFRCWVAWSFLFARGQFAGFVGRDDLETLVKPLLLSARGSLDRARELEARNDGALQDMLVEEFPQLVGGTGLHDDLGRFLQLGQVLLPQGGRADEGDDGVSPEVLVDDAHEAPSGEAGAEGVLRFVVDLQFV